MSKKSPILEDGRHFNSLTVEEREQRFIHKLNEIGRYEYIEGYRSHSLPVKVRHKKCGAVRYLTASALSRKNKVDYCDSCRVVKNSKKIKEDKTHLLVTETAFRRYCNREAMHLYAVLYSEGFLFGEELREFVFYNAKDFNRVRDKVYAIDDCVEACLDKLYSQYEKGKIGICRKCKKLRRGSAWGTGYERGVCAKCNG